jgi:hypothetical protein
LANGILEQVQEAASKRLLFLPHTIRQMARPDRMITTSEVEEVIILTNGHRTFEEDFEDGMPVL